MKDTRVKLSESQLSRLAKPYGETLDLQSNWDIPTLAGAGGLRSTADDMLKFIAANFGDDDEPLTQSIRLSHEKRHTMDDGLAIGLGWHIAGDGITRWHNGMTGGYASWLAVVPDRNVGVVVLANTATMKITQLGEQLTRAACGIEVKPPKKRAAVAVDIETLKSYEGVYSLTPAFALTVTVEDDKLMVQATVQQKFEVFPESPTTFFYKVVGKANRVTLHQNGRDLPGDRRQ
jgi:CubicO group peptidase (beta-lactamase class C family)